MVAHKTATPSELAIGAINLARILGSNKMGTTPEKVVIDVSGIAWKRALPVSDNASRMDYT